MFSSASVMSQQRPSRIPTWAGSLTLPVLVLLLAYGLTVHHLGVKDFWWDEANSWSLARLPTVQAVAAGLTILNDPLYITLFNIWIALTGHTEFGLRYLSLIFIILSVAYLYRVTTRGFGRQAGRVAILIGGTAPLWVFYAQEVRQYALMALLMLPMVESVIDIAEGRGGRSWRPWIRLGAAEALGLYTHSFMLFAAVGVQLVIALRWLRGRLPKWGWRWIASQVGVLIATIPMIPLYLERATGGTQVGRTLGLADLWNAVWHNWMGVPWEDARRPMPLRTASWAVLALLGLGLAVTLFPRGAGPKRRAASAPLFLPASPRRRWSSNRSTLEAGDQTVRRLAADLFWLIAVGTGVTLIFWLSNSKIHPRYLVMMSGPLFMLAAWVSVALWERGMAGQIVMWGLIGALAIVSATGISNIYSGATEGYRHDQTRAMTSYLRERLGPADGIITLDPHDYTLGFYDTGLAAVLRAGFNEGVSDADDLVAFLQGKRWVSVVKFHAQQNDPQGLTPFYLERYGQAVEWMGFKGYQVWTYALDEGAAPAGVPLESRAIRWDGITLMGVSIAGGDAVTVALRWLYTGSDPLPRLAAIVRARDPETDWTLSQESDPITTADGATTEHWTPGREAMQYHTLWLAPGTPPLEVAVEVMVINAETGEALDIVSEAGAPSGQRAEIGQARLSGGPAVDIAGAWDDLGLRRVESASLAAYATDWPATALGGTVGLTLAWDAPWADLMAEPPVVRLWQRERIIGEDSGPPLQGRAPGWQPDAQPALDRRVLHVSREATPGEAALTVDWRGEHITLGTVEVLGFERTFEQPVIPHPLDVVWGGNYRLIGYDLGARRASYGETVTLTLFWEAAADGEPDAAYTVFTHILAEDGHLIGQHDGTPVYGLRPLSGWLMGEFIIDEHPMIFREAYAGEATIQVGLYDPTTLERLLTDDGADAVVLPLRLEVVSPE